MSKFSSIILGAIAVFLSTILSFGLIFFNHQSFVERQERLYLELHVESQDACLLQVFYDTGNGWSEKESVVRDLIPGRSKITQFFELPDEPIFGIRFDPTQHASQRLFIHRAQLVDGNKHRVQAIPLSQIKANNGISQFALTETLEVVTDPDTNDAQLYFDLEYPLGKDSLRTVSDRTRSGAHRWLIGLLSACLTLGIAVFLFKLFQHVTPILKPLFCPEKVSIQRDSILNPRLGQLLKWGIGLLFAYQLLQFVVFAVNYFYLMDDFMVLHKAEHLTFVELFTSAQIDFYRPIVFSLFKLQIHLFGWGAPFLFSLSSILLHTFNAFLLGVFVYRLTGGKIAAMLAALLFYANPWSGESPLWVCLQSDLAAVTGTLFVLILGMDLNPKTTALKQYILIPFLLFLSALFAALGKESALILPAVYGLVLVINHQVTDVFRSPRFYFNMLGICFGVGVYMLLRSQYLSAFGGAYGNYFDLIKDVRIFYLLHSFFIPAGHKPDYLYYTIVQPIYAGLFFLFLGYAFAKIPRVALLLFLSFAFALLPILNFEIPINSTAGTRWLYLPSLMPVILFSLAFQRLLDSSNKQFTARSLTFVNQGLAASLLIVTFLFLHFGYLANQRENWKHAASISKTCIQQFAEVKDRGEHFYIRNIPHMFREGSVIISSHVFRYYFDENDFWVRGEMNILAERDGFFGVIYSLPDKYSEYQNHSEEIAIDFDYQPLTIPKTK